MDVDLRLGYKILQHFLLQDSLRVATERIQNPVRISRAGFVPCR